MRPQLLFVPGIHGFIRPTNGGQLRTRALLDRLSESFDLHIYSDKHVGSPEGPNIISNVIPEFHKATSRAQTRRGTHRPLLWLGNRMANGYHFHQSSPGRNWSRWMLTRWLGTPAAHRFDIILFDTLSMVPFQVNEQTRKKCWLSAHNVDHVLYAQTQRSDWCEWHEKNLDIFFSGVIACTEHDLKTFRSLNADIQGIVWPNGCRLPNQSSDEIEKRFDLGFIGALNYPPNVQALTHYFSQIHPLLDSKPTIALIGKSPSPEIEEFTQRFPEVTLIASPEEISPWLHLCKTTIVPLLHGSGSRLKIAESLIHGIPCISTEIGAEGYSPDTPGLHIIPDDDPARFADALKSWLNGEAESEAQAIASHARRFLWDNTIQPEDLLQYV